MVDIPRWAERGEEPDAVPKHVEENRGLVEQPRGLLDDHPREGVQELMRQIDAMFGERAAQFIAAAEQLQMESEEAARVSRIKRNMATLFSSAAGDLRAAVSAALTTIEKSGAERSISQAAAEARDARKSVAEDRDPRGEEF